MSNGCRCSMTRFGETGLPRTRATGRTPVRGVRGYGLWRRFGSHVSGWHRSRVRYRASGSSLNFGKNAELPRSSLIIALASSCFFIGLSLVLDRLLTRQKDLPDEFVVGMGGLGTGVEREDVHLSEVD